MPNTASKLGELETGRSALRSFSSYHGQNENTPPKCDAFPLIFSTHTSFYVHSSDSIDKILDKQPLEPHCCV